ncbi:4497_t:CDS:2 [Funneliformis caledonium]|uniref:4497_t:CDS:1 n=1 Tax=Funneliformis caledonium TaxID=1117310 RepID=A0A9N8ZB79_9GLOM|nr:4497_t:CDS:2 [Funneliformis caledonium]
MESWNTYSQTSHGTPSSTWLCPQNNSHGSDWLQPQNNSSIERERNENTALATPTRFMMEYNEMNQTSTTNPYFSPFAQEMDRLFDLKIGNQEDLLNNSVYSNEDFSFLNTSESIVSVSTSTIPISNTTSNRNVINSPTPSLVTDDDQDQLYNINEQLVQYPIVTSSSSFISSNYIADDQQKQRQIQYPTPTSVSFPHSISDTTENNIQKNQNERQTLTSSKSSVSSSPISQSSSPVVVNESHKLVQQSTEREQSANYSVRSTSSFYQSDDKQDLYIQGVRQRLYPSINDTMLSATPRNLENRDQYLQAKKHDPKQLLLPLTVSKPSTDVITITSPSSSFATDDDEMEISEQRKSNRQSGYQDFQLSISTNDLPMQQPSPASSEYYSSNSKTPPSSHDTTPKEKKRRASQKKINSKRPGKLHDETLITPIDESHSDIQEQALMAATSSEQSSTVVVAATSTETNEGSSNTNSNSSSTKTSSNMDTSSGTSSADLDTSTSCIGVKRNSIDDGHDETPEEKRSRLLERNRIAAAKCRQKKKQAQESLQHQASDLTQKNTGLHSVVNDLREEALRLKNQLLAHSTCNCNVIQEYVRTSGQFAFARAPFTK